MMSKLNSILSYWFYQFILCGPACMTFLSEFFGHTVMMCLWVCWALVLVSSIPVLCPVLDDTYRTPLRTLYIPKRNRSTMMSLMSRVCARGCSAINTTLCQLEIALARPTCCMKFRKTKVFRSGVSGERESGIYRKPREYLRVSAPIDQPLSFGLGMSTTSRAGPVTPPFDSDSYILMIDNCCSKCVTNCSTDFVGVPTPVHAEISGVGGPIAILQKGTVKWSIQDDFGRIHHFRIPGTYYAPDAPFRMFSPQHWSKEINRCNSRGKGAWCATYEDKVTLHWGNNGYVRSVLLDPATNVATLFSAPGTKRYQIYEAIMVTQEPNVRINCFNMNMVTDDECSGEEGDESPLIRPCDYNDNAALIWPVPNGGVGALANRKRGDKLMAQVSDVAPNALLFHDSATGLTEIEDSDALTATAELLRTHYQLGHLPFKQVRNMASTGFLPKRLLQGRIPKCTACMYGKATRRAWRSKALPSKVGGRTATCPGQCVSVDQMMSPTPGLISQLKGIPTMQRYTAATVFVNHFSRLLFVHLQRSLTSDDTVRAKRAFERFCESHGVKVLHYHADNGRFADALFLQDVADQRQEITYCGVNAHFQNGVAEKRIRDLQDMTRTALLHATARWPKVISNCLWPYALRTANDAIVSAPRRLDGKSAASVFSRTDVSPKIGSFRPFGCPVYALSNQLAAGQSIPKWYKRARVGVYLGQSPQHARSVALVLNVKTGLVSPQFHVAFDDMFETVGKGDDSYETGWLSATHFSSSQVRRESTLPPTIVDRVMEGVTRIPDLLPPVGGPEENAIPHHHSAIAPVVVPQGGPFPHQSQTDGPQILPTDHSPPPAAGVRWSQRHKPSRRLQESVEQGFLCSSTVLEDIDGDEEYQLQVMMDDAIAFVAKTSDPDTLRADQALREPDRKQFIAAMEAEVMAHHNNHH